MQQIQLTASQSNSPSQLLAATSSALATTLPKLATTFLHQQIPVLNQRPSSCTSGNQSCTSDHLSNEYQSCTSYPDLLQRLDPAPMITIRSRRLFTVLFSDLRFAIIKFGLSKQHPCFVILALFVVNHLYFKSLQGPVYLSDLCNMCLTLRLLPSGERRWRSNNF